MDIRKYLRIRNQKELSDKSSGKESDTEESLCHADKSKTFMFCPICNKLSWAQFEDPKVGSLVLFVRNGEGHLQVKKVGGGQGELLMGTMPLKQHSRSKWHQTHQSLREWLSM